jgi:hypothetical protein
MKIWQYDSYGDYVRVQTEGNKLKLKHVFVKKGTMQKIRGLFPSAKSFLCHGTRNAAEQKFFQEVYGKDIEVMGTEISDTATQFPNTVQWDFMKVNPDWVGKFDVVYSNSFDHCTDPEHTLKVWSEQIKQNGRLFVELALAVKNNKSRPMDPLELSREEFVEITNKIELQVVSETKLGQGGILFELKK